MQRWLPILALACLLPLVRDGRATQAASIADASGSPKKPNFAKDVRPVLTKYCVTCHTAGKARGNVKFDDFKDDTTALKNPKVWEKVADNLRSSTMPPAGKPQPTTDELDAVNTWIDYAVFKVDCNGPKDPGRVTLRRLNKAEYNNTIRDLLGIKFTPADDFPADDVGYGFDNIGDVLSMPPILMEKYLAAAEKILDKAFADDAARKRIMEPVVPEKFKNDRKSRIVLRMFGERAWRRPVTEDEMKRLEGLVDLGFRNGETQQGSIKLAMTAVLSSPHFLFRIEADPDAKDKDGIRTLNEWELATRLSYFLWSSMPDEELFNLAREGKLRENLEQQVKRMLADPHAKALTDNFAGQWLQTRSLKTFTPDPKLFPNFNEKLRRAMLKETDLYFEAIVREDRSIMEFIDSDYTYVNETLAKHYGIPDVKGDEFRKVTLPNDRRGGVLTQASVLSVTSNPTRTSPVKRGKWILDNILGTPPPPPPPGVEELKEGEQQELKGSLRQRMEQHRANPSCANCHQRMDTLGFGFENFDAIGGWRTKDGKHDIDPTGELPGGKKFKTPAELRGILKERPDDFAKCLSEKMLTYALGRGTERYDRCAIEEIARNVKTSDYRFSALVLEIVKSDPFQKRRGKK
jgi:mono/diheme cytochrome c family protein